MNKLPIEKRVAIISALVEGNSFRSTSRMVGVSINTVTKLPSWPFFSLRVRAIDCESVLVINFTHVQPPCMNGQ